MYAKHTFPGSRHYLPLKRSAVPIIIVTLFVGVGFVYCSSLYWERLDLPEELQATALNGNNVEDKASAATLLRQGSGARLQIRRALSDYQGDDPEVLGPLLQATQRSKDWRSLPTLFRYMQHPNAMVRGRAAVAAQSIMGAKFNFRANDSLETRNQILRSMQEEYTIMQQEYLRFYTEQAE